MAGILLGLLIVINSCITVWCYTYCWFPGSKIVRCELGCCQLYKDCCYDRPTSITGSTTTDVVMWVGIGLGICLVLAVTLLVLTRIYRRFTRPPPIYSHGVAVPTTTLQHGNQMRFKPSGDVNSPVSSTRPGDTEHDRMHPVTYKQQRSYPANTPASPVYNNTPGNDILNARVHDQLMGLQHTSYLNTNIYQDPPPPYTGPNIVTSVSSPVQNQPMTNRQTPYLSTDISQDAPPPYPGPN